MFHMTLLLGVGLGAVRSALKTAGVELRAAGSLHRGNRGVDVFVTLISDEDVPHSEAYRGYW